MRLHWLPFAVDPETFKPLPKCRKVVFTGRVTSPYPLRKEIVRQLMDKRYFEVFERPKEMDSHRSGVVGDGYAKLLGTSRISFSTGSRYNYAVAKFFEIPACGTLLMSDWFADLSLLGFVPGLNIIQVNKANIAGQVESFLSNEELTSSIASNGRALILSRHTFKKRVSKFLSCLGSSHPVKRILWLTVDRSGRIMQHFDQFRRAVANEVKVDAFGRKCGMETGLYSRRVASGDIKPKNYTFHYSAYSHVVCDAFYAYANEDWERIDIPKAVILEDLHGPIIKFQMDALKSLGVDILFHRYNRCGVRQWQEFRRSVENG